MIRLSTLAIAILVAPLLFAQSTTTFSGSVRARGESWRWFETPGFDDRYAFFGALARVGLSHRFTPRADVQLELAAPLLLGLPDQAVAPAPGGQLGFGGTYFAANGDDTSPSSVFIKQAWVRFGEPRLAIRAGRFELIDGTEVTPEDPLLAQVKRARVAHRLIGNFGFTHVGRSVDGVQFTAMPRAEWHLTGVLARPTAGAFTLEGGERLDGVDLAYAALTRSAPASDMRLFAIAYEDERDVVKTDNRPAAVRRADTEAIEITTLGAHYLRAIPVGGATIDLLLWGALQGGSWGTLDHRAQAVDGELGFHGGAAAVRVGAFLGSGDGDERDETHGTFFQVLPTPRVYARFPFYNAMNSRDLFVIGSWKLRKLTLTSELHRLRLADKRDLWYSGGGAFDERSFGFAGRPSSNRMDLATVLDIGADYALDAQTTISAYGAVARGGKVVRAVFAGRTGALVYVEVTRRF